MFISKIKGKILKFSDICEYIISEPIDLSKSIIDENNIPATYYITNSRVLSEGNENYIDMSRRVYNYLYDGYYYKSLDENSYYVYHVSDAYTGSHIYYGLLCNLNLNQVRSNPSQILGHESVINSRLDYVSNLITSIGCNISPVYLLNDDILAKKLSISEIIDNIDINNKEIVVTYTYKDLTHSIIKLNNVSKFIESKFDLLDKLWIADGHHRFNSLLNSNLNNLFVMISDISEARMISNYNISKLDVLNKKLEPKSTNFLNKPLTGFILPESERRVN